MPITPQDAAETLAALGKKPWEVSLSEDPDGAIVATPTRTDYRGAFEVGLRHMGAGAPRAIGSALAMTHGAPLIAGASALGTATTTPIGGAIAGGATAIGLGAVGGEAADALVGDPVRKLVLGDEAQRARDLEAHPTAAKVGDFLASAAGFKLPGRELLMGAVKAPVAAFGKAVLSGAEKEALKAAAVNAGVGGTMSAGQQLYRTGTVDPGEVLGAAAESAPFGHPRDFVGGLKRGFGPAPVLAPPVAPSEATGAPAPLPENVVNYMADMRERLRRQRGVPNAAELQMAQEQMDAGRQMAQTAAAREAEVGRGQNGPVPPDVVEYMADMRERLKAEREGLTPAERASIQDIFNERNAAKKQLARSATVQADIEQARLMKIAEDEYNKRTGFVRTAESAPPQGYEAPRPASLYEPPTVREVKALPWNEPPKPEAPAAEAAPAPTTAPDDTYEFGQAYEQPTATRRAGPRPQEVRGPLNPGQPESTLLQEQLLKEGSPFVQESTPATKRRAEAPEVEASEPRAEEAVEVVEPVDEVPGAPLSYEQALGQDASPVGKYMPGAKLKARKRSVLKDAPTPEPAPVTAEAVRLAADPATSKKAAFIPAGSPEPALPENVVAYQRKRGAKGKVVVNPAKVTPQEVTELQNAEQVPGKLLGLSQDVKPAEAAGDFVVTDSGGQPAVMTEVVKPGADAIEAAKAAQQAAAPGSTQRVVPGEQVLAEREAGLDATAKQRALQASNHQDAFDDAVLNDDKRDLMRALTRAHKEGFLSHQDLAKAKRISRDRDMGPKGILAELSLDEIRNAQKVVVEAPKGKVDKALDYLESKKIDTGGTFDATAGIPAAAWNGAIDLAKLALRAGRSVAEAVEAVIAHLREMHGAKLDEAKARERLTAELNGHVARSPEQITKEFEASQAKAPVPAPEPILESKRGAGIDGAGAGVNSLLRTAYERSKPLGEALAGFGTEQRSLAAKATSVLGNLPRDAGALANSVRLKMQNAALSNTVPEFTPEELPVAKAIGDFFKHTRETANARGHAINEQPNYFSEIVNQDIAVAMQKNSEATRAETTKRFVDYQADIAKARGQEFTPEKALEAREDWHSFLNTLGSDHTNLEGDFGALSKRARQWHLPPEFQDPDAIRAMNRYATRYSRQLAREQWIDTNPEALAALKNADQVDARHYVSGTLSTKGGSPLIGAAQRLANSAVMQTSSAIWQSLQKYNNYAAVTHDLPLLWNATMQTIKNFEAQRAGAVGEGVVKPNHDYTQGADLDIPGALAANFDKASSFLRKNSLAGALENANRIQDFTVGQQLATEALNGRNPGFLEKFNEGAHKGLTPEENRDRMAANFVEFVQGSYGAKGLPAWQLKGTPQATLFRIQRYGWENMLRTYQYTIEPAKKGDIGPLLTYMLAGAVTAPVVNKLREVLGGLPGNAKRAIEGQHVTGADIWQGRKSGLPTAREIDVATADPSTGKDQLMEYALNAMSLADLAGSYGFLGKAAGSVAGAVRGHSSAVVGDPSLSLSLSLLKTFGSAAEAIRNGEPVIPTIQTAVANGILDNMQMTRGATGDLGEVNDQRDKGVFNYLSGRHEPTVNKALMGMLVGNTFSDQAREISPTKEAAAQGDRAALLQLTPQERKSLDNYKGGFESPKLEGPHQQFLLMTQGPEALDAYRARRMDFVRRAHGAPELVR